MVDGRLPPLVSIRAFEVAARHSSFSAAARELGTTAASVSYHVRQLERAVGVRLFVRHPQKVALTDYGAIVADEASKAFAALRASFVRAADADAGRLSITALPSFGTSWLTPRLGAFRVANPGIRIELELSEVAQDLGTGCFDAAIRNGHGDWPGLIGVPLFPSIFVPLCAPALSFAAEQLGTPHTTPPVPLLGRPDWWNIWCRKAGREPFSADQFGTTLAYEYLDIAAAIAGHGIAIGSPILFHDDIASGRLIVASNIVADDGRAFWLVYPRAHHTHAKLGQFRSWLLSEAERTYPPPG